MRYFIYAMGLLAREEELKVHKMHPDQADNKRKPPPPGGAQMALPGGTIGTKRQAS